MTFGYLRSHATLQGNIKLTMWDAQGNVKYDDSVIGTEDINLEGLHLWDAFEIKYLFAAADGYLHIDFEWEE